MTYITVILLLIFSGLLSGLNLGLMSLEPNELKRKAKLGDVGAAKVYTIRRKGNQLLVTLILSNVAVNVSLAIILDSIAAGVVAVIVATLLITLFGEVIPQSVFSRFALPFGARMAFFVKYLMIILSPICKPIAWVLDKGLGEELPTVYSRKELIEILEEHGSSQSSDIKRDEEKIASGALSFGSRLVKDVMTPRSVVVTLTASHVITHHTIATLVKHGYSRFPVTNENGTEVIGILYVHGLLNKNVEGKQVEHLINKDIRFVSEIESLDKALKGFMSSRQKMSIVINEFAEFVGVLTLEDILEEILGGEIVDEFDEFTNTRKEAERLAREIT